VVALALVLLGALDGARPSVARADQTVVVDFETGPPPDTTPVTDEYLATSFVHFVAEDPGFRPVRRFVGPSRAHSGSYVVDVGADVCLIDGNPGETCEFPGAGTQGRLSHTAKSVTVFAGLFTPSADGQVTARLVAFRADGSEVASSPAVPVNATNFRTPVTVSSSAGDIAAFALYAEGPGSVGGSALGFDDLTLTFPDNSLPDVSLMIGGGEPVLLQGNSVDVPVNVLRLNGSNGPLKLSVAGLPPDVTATLLPNPLMGTNGNAVLRLTATSTAAPSFTPFTITADPQGNGSVAPAIRTATSKLRVGTNYELKPAGPTSALIPECAPVDFPLLLPRDASFNGVITLTAENVPGGMTADFVPGNTLGPAGALEYNPSLRLRRGTESIPPGAKILVRASSPGTPTRFLVVPIAAQTPTATVAGNTLGYTWIQSHPGSPGTELKLTGNGFCSETIVQVGNTDAKAGTTVSSDSRSLVFNVPRLATTGPVTVIPPGGAATYTTSNAVTVRTFRNYDGYQFENYKWGTLSWGELIDAYGYDDLFETVNPCWPFYDCPVLTPIPDPTAYLTFLVLREMAPASDGHCFGIARTLQYFLSGLRAEGQFTAGADHPYALASSSGPATKLSHFIDAQHTVQWSEESMHAFLNRSKNVTVQAKRIQSELRSDFPAVALFFGGSNKTKGHVVTAYDIRQTTDGFDIYVYNNEVPFDAASEIGPGHESLHRLREIGDEGVIHVKNGTWSFESGSGSKWSGTGGTMWAMPFNTIPEDPTLVKASLDTLKTFTLGQVASPKGAARVASVPAGTQWLPALDENAPPMAVGTLLAKGSHALSDTMKGTKDGTYSELLTGKGFSAAVTDISTGRGVRDRITAKPATRMVEFSGTRSRPLNLTVEAALPGGATHTAIVRTTTVAGGSDRTRLAPNGALIYEHHGKATRFSVELSSAAPNAGMPRVTAGPLQVAAGDRVTITPKDWRSLSKIRLEVRHATGARSTRMLKVRPVTAHIDVHVSQPTFRRTAQGREAVLVTRFSRVPADATGAVVMQLKHAGHVVKSRAVPVRRIRAGKRTDHWQLPKHLGRGYRLITHVTVIAGRARPGTLTITRSAAIPAAVASDHHIVRPGDTLWDIAKQRLPDGATRAEIAREWHRWYDVNRRVIGSDPGLILPGQVLRPPKH
jgi:hypothetical protein